MLMTESIKTSIGNLKILHTEESPRVILLQPCDEMDLAGLEDEFEYIDNRSSFPFLLVGIPIQSWNEQLSPWRAPAVFGKEDFGDAAADTLHRICDEILPAIRASFSLEEDTPVILGGYSLAALFSLWAAYQKKFTAIAAASPSVWFPDWEHYYKTSSLQTNALYLSLGDREEKTKNKVMQTVGDRIREMDTHLMQIGANHVLEWNEGNHFKDAPLRTAKGFVWCMEQISNK